MIEMNKIYNSLVNKISDIYNVALDKVINFLKENNNEYEFDNSHIINLKFNYYDDDYDLKSAFMKGIKMKNNELYVISHKDISYNYKNECANETILKILKEIEK